MRHQVAIARRPAMPASEDRRYWVRTAGGGPTGPFRPVELRALVSLGRLQPVDEVRDGGVEGAKWYPATRVKNLFGTRNLRAEAERQLRTHVPAGTALPPVRRRRGPAAAPPAVPAEPEEPADESFADAARDGDDDLPDAVVGTDDEFVESLDVPEVHSPAARRAERLRKKTARSPRRSSGPDAGPASSGAAAALVERARGELDAPPPRHLGRKSDGGDAPEAAPANLNRIVLLTVLAIPAAGFGMVYAIAGHQSDRGEWRQAFDRLDGMLNEFKSAAVAPDPQWRVWEAEFAEARPDLEYLVERAPIGSAGNEIREAVSNMGTAVNLRRRGADPKSLDIAVDAAVEHGKRAAVLLGMARKMEWAG